MSQQLDLSQHARERLSGWLEQHDVPCPSLNFAVFDRSGVVFHEGSGEFKRDGRRPLLDTIYRICSMSKSFCAAAVLILRERGMLSLDDPVKSYVADFPNFVDPHGREVAVTIGMLMSNSSGLPEDNAWADHNLGMSRDDLYELLCAGLNYGDMPDVGFQYSNLAFAVLGLVVENVTGQSFEDFATESLLVPLGLRATRYDFADFIDGGEDGAGLAHGFDTFDKGLTWFERTFVETGAFACLGSIYSTLPDIARWSSWLSSAFDEGNGDDAILSRAARRSMQRIVTSIHQVDRSFQPELDNSGYGLGLCVDEERRFGTFAFHAGGLPGFTSHMRWHTSSGIGVVMFANTNNVPLTKWSSEILRIVMHDSDVPARRIRLWPATVTAALLVEEIVRGTRQFVQHELFSHNLLSDVPTEVRRRRLSDLIDAVGGLADGPIAPLTQRLRWAESAAHLCWTIPGVGGDLECRMELTETEPSLVQRLEVVVAKDPAEEPALVTRHYEPVVDRA